MNFGWTFNKSWLLYCFIFIFACLICSTHVEAVDIFFDMELISENEWLKLYLNEKTTEIAVLVKDTGQIWYSNPKDRDTKERIASGIPKEELNSQFVITYGDRRLALNSYSDAVAHEQFQIVQLENGIRIEYVLGEKYNKEHLVPDLIRKDRFETLILDCVNSVTEQNRLTDAYVLVSLVEMDGTPRGSLPGLDMNRLFGNYRLVIHDQRFIDMESQIKELDKQISELEISMNVSEDEITKQIRQRDKVLQKLEKETQSLTLNILEMIRDKRSDINKVSELTFADIMQLVDNPTYVLKRIPAFMKRSLQEIIEESNYTFEDARNDSWENNLDRPEPNTRVFFIPMEYILDGQDLVVRIPASEIEYPRPLSDEQRQQLINEKNLLLDELLEYAQQKTNQIKNSKGELSPLISREYQKLINEIELMESEIREFEETQTSMPNIPLTSISLLPYFGAAYLDQEGYIFVPDGSGALIYLNNGKSFASLYNGSVYGYDQAISRDQVTYNRKINHLPIYGLKQGEQAFLAIIESGEALAQLKADIAGKLHSYNMVYPEFTLRPYARQVVTRYQSRMYEGDIQIRYRFLHSQAATYVGMAHSYQDYLIANHSLEKIKLQEDIPFFLDLVGAVSVNKPVFGFPRKATIPLTTYSQAEDIIGVLNQMSINNIRLRYLGLLKNGVEHVYPSTMDLENVLGSKQELLTLADCLQVNDGQLYIAVNFMNVYKDSGNNGFRPSKDAARFLDGLIAKTYDYDLVTYQKDRQNFRYILSPSVLGSLIESFLMDYQMYNIGGIALLDVGLQVNSDFRIPVEKTIDRQQSVSIITDQLKKVQNDYGLDILVEGANAYTLPYAKNLLQVPMSSTGYNIVDKDIPFYQIVFHGFVDYAGEPINILGNDRNAKLKLIETGAVPYYQWFYADPSVVKGTCYEDFYSLHYRYWVEDAGQFYREANEVLKKVRTSRIIKHEELADGVYKTVYENNLAVIVNYNDTTFTINNIEIEPLGFCLAEEGV